jgi:hypothetical protein
MAFVTGVTIVSVEEGTGADENLKSSWIVANLEETSVSD